MRRTHGTLPEGRLDQSVGFLHVDQLNLVAPPHSRVGLGKSNHALELSRRGSDSLLLGSRVDTRLTHLDVGLDQGVRRRLGEDRVDFGSSVRNVRSEQLDRLFDISSVSESLCGGSLGKRHTIMSWPAVSGLSSR